MPEVINQSIEENFALYNGDSCEVIKGLPDNSIHYTLFSPPVCFSLHLLKQRP